MTKRLKPSAKQFWLVCYLGLYWIAQDQLHRAMPQMPVSTYSFSCLPWARSGDQQVPSCILLDIFQMIREDCNLNGDIYRVNRVTIILLAADWITALKTNQITTQ
jgi:hypothetical protein